MRIKLFDGDIFLFRFRESGIIEQQSIAAAKVI